MNTSNRMRPHNLRMVCPMNCCLPHAADDEGVDFFHVLQDIVTIYNRRLQEVETDLSLQIDVR
jgi:hypothetical protein